MKLVLLVIALLLLPDSCAEVDDALLNEVGFDRLQSVSMELGGLDARETALRVLSGDFRVEELLPSDALQRMGRLLSRELLNALSILAVPSLAALILKMTLGRCDETLTLLFRLACALGLIRRCVESVQIASEFMEKAVRLANAVTPVLSAVLTLTGSGAAATSLSPLSVLCTGMVENGLMNVGLPLCTLTAIVAACGSLSDRFRLDRLFVLLCRAVVWGVRVALGAYVALLALEGRLRSIQDSATAQAAGQALRGLIPFIGGSVSDSAGALAQSALSVRGAVGVTGLLVALSVCARPVLTLTVHMLSLQLASAIIEPLADPGIARVAAGFGEVSRMLLALCAGSAMLVALLSGSCLGLLTIE